LVTDVTGLDATTDRDAWAGVELAAQRNRCLRAVLLRSTRPSDYQGNLTALVQQNDDLVVAASFLLTDAVAAVAERNPETRFVLVDPLVPPASLPNLAVVGFDVEQTGFLAGALASIVSQSQIVAGIYGPAAGPEVQYRTGFEQGARYVNPTVRVLGVYQSASDGTPYHDPVWGAREATAFIDQGADVIFAAGGATGQGALLAAAQGGRACIAAENADGSSCLLAIAVKHVDLALAATIEKVSDHGWAAGYQSLDLDDDAVGLSLLPTVSTATRQRLQPIADMLLAKSKISKN
jgi:basic membrane protein A and related proteins